MGLKLKQLSNGRDVLNLTLEEFEGPLDLLLYLVEKGRIDVLNLSMQAVAEQFKDYIGRLKFKDYDTISQYLEFAATLLVLKTEELLDKKEVEDKEKPIVKKLLEYKQIKQAAINLENIPRKARDVFVAKLDFKYDLPKPEIEVSLDELVATMASLSTSSNLSFIRETISVEDKKYKILGHSYLNPNKPIKFTETFNKSEGKPGAIAAFLATLDFVKDGVCNVDEVVDNLKLKF